jgi:tetratricopeptide (TPR) repeat protein
LAKGRVSAQELRRDPLMEQYVKTQGWVKDRSRPLLTWLTVAAAVIAIALIAWLIFSRRATNAAEAMARAYCWNDALVRDPVPPNAAGCVATTEEEKHRKAYEAFEQAARDYSANRDMGRYLAATHQVYFEPQKAAATLQELGQQDSELGAQARLALAQHYEASGKYDEAIAEYQKLKAKPGAVPQAMIDLNIARTYEAMGKTKEAIEGYFAIANNKELRSTALGMTSMNRLTVLAPERVEQLPPPEGGSPMGGLGGMGGGMPISVR